MFASSKRYRLAFTSALRLDKARGPSEAPGLLEVRATALDPAHEGGLSRTPQSVGVARRGV